MWYINQKNILKTFGWHLTVHDCSIADMFTYDIMLFKTAAVGTLIALKAYLAGLLGQNLVLSQ